MLSKDSTPPPPATPKWIHLFFPLQRWRECRALWVKDCSGAVDRWLWRPAGSSDSNDSRADFQLRPMMSSSLFNKTQLCSGTENAFNDHSSTTSHDTSKLPTGDPFTLHVKTKSAPMEQSSLSQSGLFVVWICGLFTSVKIQFEVVRLVKIFGVIYFFVN